MIRSFGYKLTEHEYSQLALDSVDKKVPWRQACLWLLLDSRIVATPRLRRHCERAIFSCTIQALLRVRRQLKKPVATQLG